MAKVTPPETQARDELNTLSYLLGSDGVIREDAATNIAWIAAYLNGHKAFAGEDSVLQGYLDDSITDLLFLLSEIFSEEEHLAARYVMALRCRSRIDILMEYVSSRN